MNNVPSTSPPSESGKALCVLDAKYKAGENPDTGDVAQAVAYAEMKGCSEAILVYPVQLPHALDAPFGKIRVRNMNFSLSGDLESKGQLFLDDLLHSFA